jgi:diguanylate cyclase (GGDEF)-like protein
MNRSKDNRVIERTIDDISSGRKLPDFAFFFVLFLCILANIITSATANTDFSMPIGGVEIPVYVFAGVFSSVSNICIIFMAVLFGKKGYYSSLTILLIQIPFILIGVVKNQAINSIPGIFGNILAIIAITFIYKYNQKVDRFQSEMQHQAVTDQLTGLPNSYAATALLKDLISHNTEFVNVTININRFKNLNETLGFNAGNEALIEVASRWRKLCESGSTGTHDFIAHLTGDEFALVIRDYSSEEDYYNTIKQYDDALNEKMTIDGCDIYLTASFGYVVSPDEANTLDAVCTYSMAAMHEIKRKNSSNHILHFTPDLIEGDEKVALESKIRKAIENDTVFFNLQPQFSIDHKLHGFEALARMKDPDGNIISPAVFIPIAERTGLVDKIDAMVFKKSAEFTGEIIKKTGLDITLSINVSVKHLMKNDFLDEVQDIIKATGLKPENLEIEITESVMIESMDRTLHCVKELESMGIRISIDDFGTGYSSLSYLHTLPVHQIKIDKSFIDAMNSSESSKKYVAAIISIGHILGFDVISEGVEEDAQLETLRQIGCDYIQGYIWGKPLDPEKAMELAVECSKDK